VVEKANAVQERRRKYLDLQNCEFSITRQDVRSRNVLVLNREEVDKVRRRHSN
jgi:hypothetical protein